MEMIDCKILKRVLKETSKSFDIKFQPQCKERKSVYQVRDILALFCNLNSLILS